MKDINQTIRLIEGADFEDDHYPYRGLILVGLAALGIAAFAGAAYSAYKALEALFG
jgi:hypothetical protein